MTGNHPKSAIRRVLHLSASFHFAGLRKRSVIRSLSPMARYFALSTSPWRSVGGSVQTPFSQSALSLGLRSEEHTSELQSLMRISYAVFCLKKKNKKNDQH